MRPWHACWATRKDHGSRWRAGCDGIVEAPVLSARQIMDLDTLVSRVDADFREFPGMRLTARQARRLWAIDDHTLDVLVRSGVLRRHANGTISRAHHVPPHTGERMPHVA